METWCKRLLAALTLTFLTEACATQLPTVVRKPLRNQPAVLVTRNLASPVMAVRGRVLLPVSLVSDSGGSLVTNNGVIVTANGAQLISNNSGGMIAERAFRLLQASTPASGIDELAVTGITVSLADARGVGFESMAGVQSKENGVFEIPDVPRGLTYTVQATLQTPNGEVRVKSLVASEKSVTVTVSSSLVVEALRQVESEHWGSLDEVTFDRCTGVCAKVLKAADSKLAFVSAMRERKDSVLQRIMMDNPELSSELQSVSGRLRQVSRDALAIASELRRRPSLPSALPAPTTATSVVVSPSATSVSVP